MEEWRRNNLNTMLTMSTQTIAAALETGSIPESMQVVRDYQLLYPELWAEVQNERKKIQ
jgi:hypothetical protein